MTLTLMKDVLKFCSIYLQIQVPFIFRIGIGQSENRNRRAEQILHLSINFGVVAMKSISFAELTKKVHLINDLILTDMIYEDGETEDADSFSKHLLSSKYWFARVSWANKKRYLLALLQDIRSAWTLSLMLKSMWNCRPKDAVMSVCESTVWSSFDQVPMDHNRTALPVTILAQVMKNDRIWFLSLKPEPQALVLCELLTVAGGPLMWEVLNRARVLYDAYQENMLQDLQECTVVSEHSPREKSNQPQPHEDKSPGKKDTGRKIPSALAIDSPGQTTTTAGTAQKELETNLSNWNAKIKSMRDSLKLEELEMTFNDGTERKIWKVNRSKPEFIETVDFLLPSAVAKTVLSYLPRAQLADYARVNKYWSYLVDELRAEQAARIKINADLDRLNEMLLCHDTSLDNVDRIDLQFGTAGLLSSQGVVSISPSTRQRQPATSIRASEKSAGLFSVRNILMEKLNKPSVLQRPIKNMADLTERLERRGAADENLWQWCENILKKSKKMKKNEKPISFDKSEEEGVLQLGNVHFPCPLMKYKLQVPLESPLFKDPARSTSVMPKRIVSDANLSHMNKVQCYKRYSLWTRDLTGLYPVSKIPSYYQYS